MASGKLVIRAQNGKLISIQAPTSPENDVSFMLPSTTGMNNQILSADENGNLNWRDIEALEGPQGVTGNNGSIGLQGIDGPIGATGPIGPAGEGSSTNTASTSKLYVDGTIGDDLTATGNFDKPFKTIQACLNFIGQPISMSDALRHFSIYLSDSLTASIGNNSGSNQSWNGVYKENLIVPSRMITIYGAGVKIGDNVYNVDTGFGNILKEYSSSRRFGVSSSDIRPCLTICGLTEARDNQSRLRTGIHVGGTCRTSILKRNFDSIQGNGTNQVTIHVTSGQHIYPITVTSTYPTEPRIRIAIQGTTNYNATYDITSKVDESTFIATRISSTNANTDIETSGTFFESDSAGASGVTHDAAFINCYMMGKYTCDDGTVNSAAPTAGGEVLYSVGCKFYTGIEGRGITLQRWDNTTLAGTNIVSSIAGVNNCSFAGSLTTNTFTYGTDDMGWMNCRFNSAFPITVNNASQTVRMDSTSYNSFLTSGSTWITNTPVVVKDFNPTPINLIAKTTSVVITTIFTPPVDSTYQVNVYCSCTTAGSAGTITPIIGWKDDTTTQSLSLSAVDLTIQGNYFQQIIFIKCKAGQPITYATTVTGATGSPQYSLSVSVINIS